MATRSSAAHLLHTTVFDSSAPLSASVLLANKRHSSTFFLQNRHLASLWPASRSSLRLARQSKQRSRSSQPTLVLSNTSSCRRTITCQIASNVIDSSSTSPDTITGCWNGSSITTTDNKSSSYINITTFRRRREHEAGFQELTIYEVNERDRDSPVLLPASKLALDWYNRLQLVGGLGDLVPFTNKIFDGSLKKRLGITAGIISIVRHVPEEDGLLFESIYSFYFGDLGHISVKGPYKTYGDTILTITGGSGIFTGVYGNVRVHNVEYPIVLFYSFKLYGIPPIPSQLIWDTIPPRKGVRPSHNASLPGVALPNFTN